MEHANNIKKKSIANKANVVKCKKCFEYPEKRYINVTNYYLFLF